jgi:hypothetical protein
MHPRLPALQIRSWTGKASTGMVNPPPGVHRSLKLPDILQLVSLL